MGDLVAFPKTGRMSRVILILPDLPGHGDACRAVLAGNPLEGGEDFDFRGALWKVQMLVKDNRKGLPVIVHPEARRRARK